jgi:hypothetical protein
VGIVNGVTHKERIIAAQILMKIRFIAYNFLSYLEDELMLTISDPKGCEYDDSSVMQQR